MGWPCVAPGGGEREPAKVVSRRRSSGRAARAPELDSFGVREGLQALQQLAR
jgi:hypothetical protein